MVQYNVPRSSYKWVITAAVLIALGLAFVSPSLKRDLAQVTHSERRLLQDALSDASTDKGARNPTSSNSSEADNGSSPGVSRAKAHGQAGEKLKKKKEEDNIQETKKLRSELSKLQVVEKEAEEAYFKSLERIHEDAARVQEDIAASAAREGKLLNASQNAVAVQVQIIQRNPSMSLGAGGICILILGILSCLALPAFWCLGKCCFLGCKKLYVWEWQDMQVHELWYHVLGFPRDSYEDSYVHVPPPSPRHLEIDDGSKLHLPEERQDPGADPGETPRGAALLEQQAPDENPDSDENPTGSIKKAGELALPEREAPESEENGPEKMLRNWHNIPEQRRQELYRFLTREARWMPLVTLIPLLFLPATTCEGGMPTSGYIAYLPFLMRSEYIEWSIWKCLQVPLDRALILHMLFDAMEKADYFMDGVSLGQAYVCDETVTPVYAASFLLTPFPAVAGSVMLLRFWGLALLAFLSATLLQQAFTDTGTIYGPHMSADAAGMGFLGERLSFLHIGGNETISPRAMMSSISKACFENTFQLALQVSFFCITFSVTDSWSKGKQLLSMGTSSVSCMIKLLGNTVSLAPSVGDPWREFTRVQLSLALVAYLIFIAINIILLIRLYMAFSCPSHIWNLTGGFGADGCVAMNDLF